MRRFVGGDRTTVRLHQVAPHGAEAMVAQKARARFPRRQEVGRLLGQDLRSGRAVLRHRQAGSDQPVPLAGVDGHVVGHQRRGDGEGRVIVPDGHRVGEAPVDREVQRKLARGPPCQDRPIESDQGEISNPETQIVAGRRRDQQAVVQTHRDVAEGAPQNPVASSAPNEAQKFPAGRFVLRRQLKSLPVQGRSLIRAAET